MKYIHLLSNLIGQNLQAMIQVKFIVITVNGGRRYHGEADILRVELLILSLITVAAINGCAGCKVTDFANEKYLKLQNFWMYFIMANRIT